MTRMPVLSPCLSLKEIRLSRNRIPGYWSFFPFKPLSTQSKASINVDVLVVAKMKRRKRVYELLKGIADCSQTGMSIVLCSQIECKDDYIMVKKLKALAAICKIKLDIHLDKSHEEVLALMNIASLFVLPSVKEPAAVSVVEALAAGAVVVCSDQCGTCGYGSLGVNMIVFPETKPNNVINAVNRAAGIRKLFKREERKDCYKRHMKRLKKAYSRQEIPLN